MYVSLKFTAFQNLFYQPLLYPLQSIAFAKLFGSQNERNPIFTTVSYNSLNKIDQISTIIFKR